MIREKINVFDYAPEILKAMQSGILITAKAGDRVNSMTIGWGALGIEWAKPMFTAYIREGRYTKELLEEGNSFTINVPLEGADRKALGILGTKSGRDTDKIQESGITYVPSEIVDAPAVEEYALTLECKIVYRKLQDKNLIDESFMYFYPQDVDSTDSGANKDFHIEVMGEIVAAYILK